MAQMEIAEATPRQRLLDDGVTIVRGFLGDAETAALQRLVGEVYQAMAACPQIPDPGMAENYKRWNGVWLRPLPQFLKGNALATRYSQAAAKIARRTRSLLGGDWRLYPPRSYFRKYTGAEELVPWHIDADAAGIGRAESINVWLPLNAVGANSPSLEIAAGSHRKMRALPLLTEGSRYRDDSFAASAGSAIIVPRLDPGDAAIFDQFTLHRTQPMAGVLDRTSCEFRFIKLSGWRRALSTISSQWPPALFSG